MTIKEDLIKKFKEKHGRNPPTLSPQQIDKLDYAFLHCASDKEAYTYAGVCKANFYYWQEVNPHYVDRKAELRDLIKYQARENIVKGIKMGSASESKWWLERKNKEEFSLRVENTGKDGDAMVVDVILRDDINILLYLLVVLGLGLLLLFQ